MSGHSKWSQIKHKKGITDQKRGRVFSKLSKKISIAAREGADPDSNYKLKSAVDEAKAANMPKDNIERAIKKASEKGSSNLKEAYLQAIGPESLAIVIEIITDNTNRTVAEIKNILNKNHAKLAEPGSLDWIFEKKGIIKATIINENEESSNFNEDIELKLIEAGAEDIKKEEWDVTITAPPELLNAVKRIVDDLEFSTEYAQVDLVPKTMVAIKDTAALQKVKKLFNELDEHDDVENIYSNMSP